MKKVPKMLFHFGIASAILFVGVKLFIHFLEKFEEEDNEEIDEHREPYQPEEV